MIYSSVKGLAGFMTAVVFGDSLVIFLVVFFSEPKGCIKFYLMCLKFL